MDELLCRTRFDEANLRTANRRALRPAFLIQLALCILCFAMATRHVIRDHALFPGTPILLVLVLVMYGLGAFYLWRTLTMVKRSVTRTLDRSEEKWHVRGFDTTIRFTDTEFIDKDSVSADENRYTYAVVKRLVPYKHLILLHTQARQFLMLDRTRFENGTEADFWRLMNEKCPDAVPKKYRA